MLLVLKIPIVYLCVVIWWAIKAEPSPPELAGGGSGGGHAAGGRASEASASGTADGRPDRTTPGTVAAPRRTRKE